jgi:hypothetical protein
MLNISYQIDRGLESTLERQPVLLTGAVCHLAGERLWFAARVATGGRVPSLPGRAAVWVSGLSSAEVRTPEGKRARWWRSRPSFPRHRFGWEDGSWFSDPYGQRERIGVRTTDSSATPKAPTPVFWPWR